MRALRRHVQKSRPLLLSMIVIAAFASDVMGADPSTGETTTLTDDEQELVDWMQREIRRSKNDDEAALVRRLQERLSEYIDEPSTSSQLTGAMALEAPSSAAASSTSHQTAHYTYDAQGRLTQVTYPGAIEVSYSYDALGNRATVTVPEPRRQPILICGFILLIILSAGRRRSHAPSVSAAVMFVGVTLVGLSVSFEVRATVDPTTEGVTLVVPSEAYPNDPDAPQAATAQEMARPPNPFIGSCPQAYFDAFEFGMSWSWTPIATIDEYLPDVSFCSGPTSTESTPEIIELARGLQNDPELMFEYVYSQIAFESTFGSNKGAMGALLDKSGNDFDQASLLIALLRAAGYEATFEYGLVQYTADEITSWLNIPNDGRLLERLLNGGGRAFSNVEMNSSGQITAVAMERVWVRLVDEGGTCNGGPPCPGYLPPQLGPGIGDPSYKYHVRIPGIDLGSTIGYSRDAFVAAALAGATRTSSYIQNVNSNALDLNLRAYANNLVSYLEAEMPGATMQEVIGGVELVPNPNPFISGQLPHPVIEHWGSWDEVPAEFRKALGVSYPGAQGMLFADTLAGKRLTLVVSGADDARLYLDGEEIASGSGVNANSEVKLRAIHSPGLSPVDQTVDSPIGTGGTFLLLNAWSKVGQGRIEHHAARSRAIRYANESLVSEAALGEGLAVLGASILTELTQTFDLMAAVSGAECRTLHFMGIVGQAGSPYFDLPGVYVSCTDELSPQTNVPLFAMINSSGHLGGYEAGVMKQVQRQDAVSTQYVLEIANQRGMKIYTATEANFLSTIKPLLRGYSLYDLGVIEAFTRKPGARVLLPENGAISVDDWTGSVYFAAANFTVSSQISGGLNGGYTTTPGITDIKPLYLPAPQNHAQSLDPIDLVTGDFLFDWTDLEVGSGPMPFGFGFSRSYNSGKRYEDGPLGLGWTHGLDISAERGSNGGLALGSRTPVDAAAAIVELFVSTDLLRSSASPQNLLIASLCQVWLMKLMEENVVTITTGGSASQFALLADGTFKAPPGSASILTEDESGTYEVEGKHGDLMIFNSNGTISSIVDHNGRALSFHYESNDPDRLDSVFSATTGRQIDITREATTPHRISEITDGTRSVSYGYDSASNLTSVTDAEGNETTLEYASDGLLAKVFKPSYPEVASVLNQFNSLGQVTSQWDALGNKYQCFYSRSRTKEAAPDGSSKVWYYDEAGRTTLQVDALGNETTSLFDGEGRLIERIAPEGNSVTYEYDGSHNVLSQTLLPKPGSNEQPIVRSMTYHPDFNRVLTETDPRGFTTTYEYDDRGNVERITRPPVNGQQSVTTYTYDPRGLVDTVTGPEGLVTKQFYGLWTADPIKTVEDFGGLELTTLRTFHPTGDLATETDPLGNTRAFEYDLMRRPVEVRYPYLVKTQYTRDPDGNVIETRHATYDPENPWTASSATYTPSGKIASKTSADQRQTVFTYDNWDRLASVTDAAGRTTTTQYDARGRVWQVKNPSSVAEKTFEYTPNGKVASVTDAMGRTTEYDWDGFDRLSAIRYPDGSSEEVEYDASANPVTFKNRDGVTLSYSYDALGRVESKNVPGDYFATFRYDRAGRLEEMSDATGLTQFSHDVLGRLEQVTYPGGKVVAYEYDANGQNTKLVYPDQYFVTYEYDELGRLKYIRDPAGLPIADYFYDALSRNVGLVRGNGTSAETVYSDDGDIESVTHYYGGDSVEYTYEYDGARNRTQSTISNPTFQFSLFSASPDQTYSTNQINQYSDVNGQAQAYDANGNLSSNATHSFTHSPEGRLLSGGWATFTYDAQGHRRSKTNSPASTEYILDGEHVIAEYDQSGQLVRRYVYGPGFDRPLMMTTDSASYYYHQDALGSVVGLTDETGALAEAYAYGPFGELAQPSALGNPFRYVGREYDPETGLYYFRARYYSPQLGRFIEVDPSGYSDGMNLYSYVGENPVNFVDPLGLFRQQGVQGGVQQAGFSGALDWVIGRDSGAAWRSAFTDNWVRGPTGGFLPESLAIGLRDVGRSVPGNAAANGMHAWHAGSNAFLAEELGLVGGQLIFLGGVYHESPLDWESFKAEQYWQGSVNHALDSVTDIGANVFGMTMGYLGVGVDRATRWGNYIPGPGEPDPAFGGGGPYKGNPIDAWGQYP